MVPAGSDRPGMLGWVLMALTVGVLVVTVVITLNLVSRETLEPVPVVTASTF